MSPYLYPDISGFTTLLKALNGNNKRVRIAFITACCIAAIAVISIALSKNGFYRDILMFVGLFFAALAFIIVSAIVSYQNSVEAKQQSEYIQRVEQQVREHPEKPKLAWDLARAKLESYLDRNLEQVKSIFWLTLIVMIGGFVLITFGLVQAFQSPDKLSVSIVASASGVLVSFIGGSFLLIYRSILTQTKDYVSVLERINAVGMAVQVIANIPDESAELKHQSTARLAEQLLGLYASPAALKKHKRSKRDRSN